MPACCGPAPPSKSHLPVPKPPPFHGAATATASPMLSHATTPALLSSPPFPTFLPPSSTRRRSRLLITSSSPSPSSSPSISPPPRPSPHGTAWTTPKNSRSSSSKKTKTTKQRPPRPSFEEQTLRRWSARHPSHRPSFPWHQPQEDDDDEDEASGAHTMMPSHEEEEEDQPNPHSDIAEKSTFNSILHHFNHPSSLHYHDDDGSGDGGRLGLSRFPAGAGEQLPLQGAGFAIGYRSAPWVHGAESPNGAVEAMEKDDVCGEVLQEEVQEELREHFRGTDKRTSAVDDAAAPEKVSDGSSTRSSTFAAHLNGSVMNSVGEQLHSEVDAPDGSLTRSSSFAAHPRGSVMNSVGEQLYSEVDAPSRRLQGSGFGRNRGHIQVDRIVDTLSSSMQRDGSNLHQDVPFSKSNDQPDPDDFVGTLGPVLLPWEMEEASDGDESSKRSNTELAERTIPEPELRRLRNAALRMKERMKIGPGGVTQAVVDIIHQKWEEDEVVKMRFEGPPSLNMKRTHEILEAKTGGIVIWRSGRSVVLFRGMNYRLQCVQSYARIAGDESDQKVSDAGSIPASSVVNGQRLHLLQTSRMDSVNSASVASSSQEATNAFDIDNLLDQLGPRYKDWSGRGPLPVDADLLPGVIPGYKPPFRLLPYKTKLALRNREMTSLRRLSRQMAPHFALGRNRQHQGLATAMVKLWEKSVIAKIAIKRGIPNTCNDRMAEEIRKLTGGVLLSRNKEYIVFYRGNDFVAPGVREVLVEKQQKAITQQDEEESARLRASASITAIPTVAKSPLVAGTLAESREAKSRWSGPQNNEEREQEKKDIALAKHTSLVKNLERKLILAKGKVAKAERALAKVQELLVPAALPTDLETVTDEERFLFRRIGLKMSAFLLLGRREVFDGTVQNMHLHWKHRELVKIMVKRKSFAQVKHIAISLEAESGGVLISLDKTTKGYAIIFYRGKNYKRPKVLKPKNLLTKRQALARSIELQRREALNYHISTLQDRIRKLKSQLEQMKADNKKPDEDLLLRVEDDLSSDDDDNFEDEGEEAYLQTYGSGDEEDPGDRSNEYV